MTLAYGLLIARVCITKPLEVCVKATLTTVALVGCIMLYVNYKIKSEDKFEPFPIAPWMILVVFVGFMISGFAGEDGFSPSLTWACGAIILFGLFLLVDIYFMYQGMHAAIHYDKDSDIMAAATIFTDMVMIFISMAILMME